MARTARGRATWANVNSSVNHGDAMPGVQAKAVASGTIMNQNSRIKMQASKKRQRIKFACGVI